MHALLRSETQDRAVCNTMSSITSVCRGLHSSTAARVQGRPPGSLVLAGSGRPSPHARCGLIELANVLGPMGEPRGAIAEELIQRGGEAGWVRLGFLSGLGVAEPGASRQALDILHEHHLGVQGEKTDILPIAVEIGAVKGEEDLLYRKLGVIKRLLTLLPQ